MDKKLIQEAFSASFVDNPETVFDLLENLKTDESKNYEVETYKDGMILSHEIDFGLNTIELNKIVKNWESLEKLHLSRYDFPLKNEGKICISIISDVYSEISKTGNQIHFDNDYDVYYDPELHDKSDWRN